jgi:hypothetical protein
VRYTEDLQVLSDGRMDHYDHFSVAERTRIVELYFATKSPTLVQRQFRREHPEKKMPHRHTISRLVDKFRNTGSVINNNKGHCGPKVTARTPANIQDVRDHLEQSPRKSTRRLSQQVGISRTSVRRIIHCDLQLFSYKVQILQAQTEANKTQRFEFGQNISERIENDPQLLNCLLFSDEAHFHLSGHVNKQNFRFWANEQPHEHVEKPLSVEKTTVWCALGKNGIVGPYFFEDDNGHRVTVNSDRYIDMLRRRFIPALRRRRGFDMNTVVFQQDGAPPHCSNRTLEYLGQHFPGDRLISRRTDNPWPPYSPDLTPLDYFLWGYLKERVYEDNPDTIDRLKENIRREIRRIPNDMLERVVNNFNVRVAHVIQRRGAWVEHVINY